MQLFHINELEGNRQEVKMTKKSNPYTRITQHEGAGKCPLELLRNLKTHRDVQTDVIMSAGIHSTS